MSTGEIIKRLMIDQINRDLDRLGVETSPVAWDQIDTVHAEFVPQIGEYNITAYLKVNDVTYRLDFSIESEHLDSETVDWLEYLNEAG